jgi:hypothetical protein
MSRTELCAIEIITPEDSKFAIGRVVRRERPPAFHPIREARVGKELLRFIDYDRTWRAWCMSHPLRQEQARALLGREFGSLDELRAAFPPLPRRPQSAAEAVERVIAGRK